MDFPEKIVDIGGMKAVVTIHPDGTNVFRLDQMDIVTQEASVYDNLGRTRVYRVHASTVLILIPAGEMGCLAYDREPAMRDTENRICFVQRPIPSRVEIATIVDQFKNNGRIVKP